jgi:recA bacterial DNA recombination protein
MAAPSADVTAALATLRSRWGAAAPRRLEGDLRPSEAETDGALAMVPLPAEAPHAPPADTPDASRRRDGIISTGFSDLDAILGPGGVPLAATVALRGAGSSGTTTLALRLVAEAQAAGSLAAWVDVGRTFDPVEAVARGVRLETLAVLVPQSLDEALAMTGTLLQGRVVDVAVLDLGTGIRAADARASRARTAADRLHRIAAVARRSSALLLVVEPPDLTAPLAGAVSEAATLRLELSRRAWVRLGRDVVGQWTDATIGRSRFGPPGRRTALRILYPDAGPRNACLHLSELLSTDAPPPSPLATPAASARPSARDSRPNLRLVPDGSDHPRRTAVDGRDRGRRESGRPGTRGPARDAARRGPPALSGGDVPRSGT